MGLCWGWGQRGRDGVRAAFGNRDGVGAQELSDCVCGSPGDLGFLLHPATEGRGGSRAREGTLLWKCWERCWHWFGVTL